LGNNYVDDEELMIGVPFDQEKIRYAYRCLIHKKLPDFVACQRCGKPILYKGRGRPPKYCDECRKTRRREIHRDYMARRRAEIKKILNIIGWTGLKSEIDQTKIVEKIRRETALQHAISQHTHKWEYFSEVDGLRPTRRKCKICGKEEILFCKHDWEYVGNFRICKKCGKRENVARLTFRTVPADEYYSKRFPRK